MVKEGNRYHFINIVKIVRDYFGEHYSPLTETDCMALCKKRDVIDTLNKAIGAAGLDELAIQLNWSEDQGRTWVQYPKSE